MAGKSPLTATDEQRAGLEALAGSHDRGEADRARGVLLTLAGWTSPQIAEAFGVREDTVRFWRSEFAGGGVVGIIDGLGQLNSWGALPEQWVNAWHSTKTPCCP